jgi:hypothetical protein
VGEDIFATPSIEREALCLLPLVGAQKLGASAPDVRDIYVVE